MEIAIPSSFARYIATREDLTTMDIKVLYLVLSKLHPKYPRRISPSEIAEQLHTVPRIVQNSLRKIKKMTFFYVKVRDNKTYIGMNWHYGNVGFDKIKKKGGD